MSSDTLLGPKTGLGLDTGLQAGLTVFLGIVGTVVNLVFETKSVYCIAWGIQAGVLSLFAIVSYFVLLIPLICVDIFAGTYALNVIAHLYGACWAAGVIVMVFIAVMGAEHENFWRIPGLGHLAATWAHLLVLKRNPKSGAAQLGRKGYRAMQDKLQTESPI